MRLRTAKKICKAMTEGRAGRYTEGQQGRAVDRMERTRSSRDSQRFWNAMMRSFGPGGRAELMARLGNAGGAFRLLMESEDWAGDPFALVEVRP